MGVAERKEREKEFRKQQILTAGQTLFVNQGLRNTTMEDIAKLCEISRGTLYLYFDSKETLFHTILLKGFSILYDMMRDAADQVDDVNEKLRAVGTAYANFYKYYKNYFKLVNQFDDHKDCKNHFELEMALQVTAKIQQVWDLITEIILDGINKGIFKKDTQPMEIALLLWSASNGVIQLMDHIQIAHNGIFPVDEMPKSPFGVTDIDFENLLRKLGGIIIDSIRNH